MYDVVCTGGRGAYAGLEPVGGDITAKIVSSVRDEGEVSQTHVAGHVRVGRSRSLRVLP